MFHNVRLIINCQSNIHMDPLHCRRSLAWLASFGSRTITTTVVTAAYHRLRTTEDLNPACVFRTIVVVKRGWIVWRRFWGGKWRWRWRWRRYGCSIVYSSRFRSTGITSTIVVVVVVVILIEHNWWALIPSRCYVRDGRGRGSGHCRRSKISANLLDNIRVAFTVKEWMVDIEVSCNRFHRNHVASSPTHRSNHR